MKKLFWLFDIDGTLIRSGGAGAAAMGRAISEAFGGPPDTSAVKFSGRSDFGITQDLFQHHGVDFTSANIDTFFTAYLRHLPVELDRRDGEVLPGAEQWLVHLAEHVTSHLGILTGNMRAAAKIKLDHFGLWKYFENDGQSFGGFGDRARHRNDVAAEAVASATRQFGDTFNPDRTWTIGDTPHDVECARSERINVIAVATGSHPLDELAMCEPDVLLPNLVDTAQLLALTQVV